MEKKQTQGKELLERVRKAKQKEPAKNMKKIVGRKKANDKFGKVNFNG